MFEFQLSKKKLVLELTKEHFSSSENIYWKHMGILQRLAKIDALVIARQRII